MAKGPVVGITPEPTGEVNHEQTSAALERALDGVREHISSERVADDEDDETYDHTGHS